MRIILCLVLAATAVASNAATATQLCLTNTDIKTKRLSATDGYYARTPNGWWRNTGAACPAYAADRALATDSTSNRQCRGDLVRVFGAFSRIQYGGCVLGSWEKVAGPPAGDKAAAQ